MERSLTYIAQPLAQQRRPDHCPVGVPFALLLAYLFASLTGLCMELWDLGWSIVQRCQQLFCGQTTGHIAFAVVSEF